MKKCVVSFFKFSDATDYIYTRYFAFYQEFYTWYYENKLLPILFCVEIYETQQKNTQEIFIYNAKWDVFDV